MNNNEQISQKIVDNYSSNTNYFNYDLEVTLNSALDQFEIRDIISIYILNNLHILVTNIGFYLTVSFFIILIFNLISNNFNRLISNG